MTRKTVLTKLNKRHGNGFVNARNLGHETNLNKITVDSHGLGYQPEDLAVNIMRQES
ncbi:hypothetical protein RHMOL_Rhmol01G0087200 [Rhododendron molle]|uniref:Uncharacterized protein n=1 Tax=Rhododendron molle TaxID=49168 RepID=A0ACC0PZB9_RHOML|nr:hypothetical protein RHMOL_Rhmol01G0087200 [Rhododendron molle]